MSAKILVKPVSGKRETAIVQWKRQRDTFKINVFNSFSQPLMSLYSTPGLARMDFADGRMQEADSAEALMLSNLGWSIPADVLSYWLQGRLKGGETSVTREDGQLQKLDYRDFTVTFSRVQNLWRCACSWSNSVSESVTFLDDYHQKL